MKKDSENKNMEVKIVSLRVPCEIWTRVVGYY